jgi:16S rRNA (guanine527-N7)-methyltransferase
MEIAMTRHIEDSLQICDMINKDRAIIDVGSGAGFPGVLLSISGFNNLTLCEKNIKKATFLRLVKTELSLNYEVLQENVYDYQNHKYQKHTITARAFAPLTKLCEIMIKLKLREGVFHKGITYKQEIEKALQKYNFNYKIKNSITNERSAIVKVFDLETKYG